MTVWRSTADPTMAAAFRQRSKERIFNRVFHDQAGEERHLGLAYPSVTTSSSSNTAGLIEVNTQPGRHCTEFRIVLAVYSCYPFKIRRTPINLLDLR